MIKKNDVRGKKKKKYELSVGLVIEVWNEIVLYDFTLWITIIVFNG